MSLSTSWSLFEVRPFVAVDHEVLIEMSILVFIIEDMVYRCRNTWVAGNPGVAYGRHYDFSRVVQLCLDL